MTIAISVKIHDGLILASDSATTLMNPQGGVLNVYNSANKIFNLHKGLPIGGMTWGAGSIGAASISTLAKELRSRFTGDNAEWRVDPKSYTMEDVAKKTRQFLYDENYVPVFKDAQHKPPMGFLVAGYSANEPLAEEWIITINNGLCDPPQLVRPKTESGAAWWGEPEAITRLILGVSDQMPQAMLEMGVPQEQIPNVMASFRARLTAPFVQAAMPVQDAIDLAEFLVHTTIMYSRFSLGAPTVGGPIELAAITKHEDFKWVRRKHYYDPQLNVLSRAEQRQES